MNFFDCWKHFLNELFRHFADTRNARMSANNLKCERLKLENKVIQFEASVRKALNITFIFNRYIQSPVF